MRDDAISYQNRKKTRQSRFSKIFQPHNTYTNIRSKSYFRLHNGLQYNTIQLYGKADVISPLPSWHDRDDDDSKPLQILHRDIAAVGNDERQTLSFDMV